MEAIIGSVSGVFQKRAAKAKNDYLAMLVATHEGSRPRNEVIADILEAGGISLDQFERDLQTIEARDAHRVLLAASVAEAEAGTSTAEAVAALHRERMEWQREWHSRLSAAIGAEYSAREASQRVPLIRQRMVETSKNPQLLAKLGALQDEHASNAERIQALRVEIEDGKHSVQNAEIYIRAGRGDHSPEAEYAARRQTVASWPATHDRLKADITTLEARQQAIPGEVEALTPEFVASVL